jgi:hypothetical protein
MGENWALESLTIGPSYQTTSDFWERGFLDFPLVPHLKELTIAIQYSNPRYWFGLGCWTYLNDLCKTGTFPESMQIDIQMSIGHSLRSGNAELSRRGVTVSLLFSARVIGLTSLPPKPIGFNPSAEAFSLFPLDQPRLLIGYEGRD